MNWDNVDLNSPFERSHKMIDGLTFETFLLEIECNLPIIDAEEVTKQFENDLSDRIDDARFVFKENLANIIKHAKEVKAIA